eukprot:1082706-Prymnesium_polylepis.1
MGDEGARALGEALKVNQGLTVRMNEGPYFALNLLEYRAGRWSSSRIVDSHSARPPPPPPPPPPQS